eukprot:12546605-Alexandrium_andersonii.AAC.1
MDAQVALVFRAICAQEEHVVAGGNASADDLVCLDLVRAPVRRVAVPSGPADCLARPGVGMGELARSRVPKHQRGAPFPVGVCGV